MHIHVYVNIHKCVWGQRSASSVVLHEHPLWRQVSHWTGAHCFDKAGWPACLRSHLSPLPQPWSYKLAPLYPEFLCGSRVQGQVLLLALTSISPAESCIQPASWDISDDHMNLVILILVHCKLQAGTEVFRSRTFCRTPNPMIPTSWHGYWTDLWACVPWATFP